MVWAFCTQTNGIVLFFCKIPFANFALNLKLSFRMQRFFRAIFLLMIVFSCVLLFFLLELTAALAFLLGVEGPALSVDLVSV